ncbi:hypothetical protein D5F01_LYC10939 [Larimichthys crocea]|uniref:Uncharacterized protein n=1 Tax=Larimichthys crocea TaxID=215358 RepID=A0A6G0IJA8_LARCR|nr:hypothetical protein D5F01_LYC10939 [Larimichthys crocea]
MGEEHSETKHEDKQRPRGPEGQRPLLPTKPSLDLSRAKTTPEKAVTSPKTSPLSPREEPSVDQRGLPAAQPIIQEEGSAERRSPPASAQHGVEAADPASQGEEKGRNGVPHTRKSNSFDIGMERDSPYDLERSSDRRFPVKKPCFPQYRNRSLDCPAGTRCYESPQLDNRDVL